ncbi:phospholipid scramblase 1 isoform X2 [Folsomia candida]|uniref:phospholipid scramblase 1 isoform X2 n=1 Tax=Folsomia candida TaxID=158441 RepID=UPI000B8F93D4|nr:phospholipid scramblase 1 isoform X2 [Folsomia candida]
MSSYSKYDSYCYDFDFDDYRHSVIQGFGAPYPPKGEGDHGYPAGPPPGYAYPPVPVPFQPDGQGAIMQQPVHGQGYSYGQGPPQPFSYGGYPPPQQQGYNPAYHQSPPMQMHPTGVMGQTVPLNVPPGLEFLAQLDRLYVKQKVELLEAFLGCETKNKYKIKDSQGRDLYTAKEDTDCCTRNCCGSFRPFDLKIKDLNDREIIHLNRPLACDSCWCPCWLQSLEVFSPPGQLAGTVEQQWSIFTPTFVIKNADGEVVLRIEGPMCTFSLCGEVEFKVLSRDGGTEVGKISKRWSGLAREAFTDADNFGINFPMDLDVRMKAVMLGACFLIDFMFFEKTANKENDMPGMF